MTELLINLKESDNSPVCSFDPIADMQSKLLILGTIPGKESLKNNRYYAHPQNAFWKIIFALHHLPFSANDHHRREVLLHNRIALWDILQSCNRKSSLDNDIRGEKPNDIKSFLLTHPNISRIFFNGVGAAHYFKKYFSDVTLPCLTMPSTSPAHAIPWEKKLEAWHAIKTTLTQNT